MHFIPCWPFRITRMGIQGFPTNSFMVAAIALASYCKATEGLKNGLLAVNEGRTDDP